jgi:membrane-associated phospholipid phosphatase
MARSTRNLAAVVFGVGTMLGAAALARRPITHTEVRIFRMANGLADEAYPAVWVPMQYGTFGTVPAAAVVALARRRPRLALAFGVGGTAAWLVAKAEKRIVGRGRPATLLEHVAVRGTEKGDRGFPSGHAAVSAALTVVAWPYASNRWRATLAALAGFVSFARMYVAAHLPLDVVGGSALGLAIGSAVNAAIPDARVPRVDAHGGEPLRGTRAHRRRRGSDPRPARRRSRAVTVGGTTGRRRRRTTAPARPRPGATNGR